MIASFGLSLAKAQYDMDMEYVKDENGVATVYEKQESKLRELSREPNDGGYETSGQFHKSMFNYIENEGRAFALL